MAPGQHLPVAPQHQGLPQEEVGMGAEGTGAQHQPETSAELVEKRQGLVRQTFKEDQWPGYPDFD